jgi:hypothetical protein
MALGHSLPLDGYGSATIGRKRGGGNDKGKRVGLLVGFGTGVLLICACLVLANGRWQQPTVLDEEMGKGVTTEDTQYCDSFDGWLKEKCLEARKKENSGPQSWSDDQVSHYPYM